MTILNNDVEFQLSLIKRGTERIIEESELVQKIYTSKRNNRPLVVKLGVDPTASDLHLGHAVVFRKLRHFQQLGHKVVFLIGDFTGRIGDPTGRDKTRPLLTEDQVQENAKTYQKQISKILDLTSIEVVFNSSWLKRMTLEDVVRLTSWTTMAKLLEHDTFRNRFEHAESIRFNEMLYPFMQAYDSVVLNADVELGGTDQTFNLTFGRDIQKAHGQEPQICITMPILPGTDGKNKMSKSLDNYVGIDEPPYTMYEKLMRMVDENLVTYFTLLTEKHLDTISEIEGKLKKEPSTEFVLQLKKELAFLIVETFHGTEAARQAEARYGKEDKEGIQDIEIPKAELSEDNSISLVRLLMIVGKAYSKSEARRLIQQGGVSVNNVKIVDIDKNIIIDGEILLRVGKSFFVKVIRRL